MPHVQGWGGLIRFRIRFSNWGRFTRTPEGLARAFHPPDTRGGQCPCLMIVVRLSDCDGLLPCAVGGHHKRHPFHRKDEVPDAGHYIHVQTAPHYEVAPDRTVVVSSLRVASQQPLALSALLVGGSDEPSTSQDIYIFAVYALDFPRHPRDSENCVQENPERALEMLRGSAQKR